MTMMKKGNVTILASILAIALVAAGVGAGTMAWFSGVQTGTGSFKTGTLTLDTVSYSSWTLDNLSPGDEWTTSIQLHNTGSLDAMYVYMAFYITADNGPSYGLADKIVLEQIHEWCYLNSWATTPLYDPNDVSVANAWLVFWDPTTAHNDGSISLYDLATVAMTGPPGGSTKTSIKLHTGNPPTTGAYLPSGRDCYIDLKFKLLDNTNNDYQGKTCSFTIKFIASNQVGTVLDNSLP
jgi:predicted ribosomally synthesized peptide with SipW-like signal peptide